MQKTFSKSGVFVFVLMLALITFSDASYAALDTKKQPPSDYGFEKDKKVPTDRKVKNPDTGKYGYKDKQGRYWVPDRNMHGGEGWTREYPDGSHDHVYEDNGNVRVHKGSQDANYKLSGSSWIYIVGAGLLLGLTILSPIPGDEIIVAGALLGVI